MDNTQQHTSTHNNIEQQSVICYLILIPLFELGTRTIGNPTIKLF